MTDRLPVQPGFCTMVPGLMDNPYALYASLRDAPPVFWAPKEGAWVLHRAAEVQTVLADRSFLVAELATVVATISQRAEKPAPLLSGLLSAFLPFVNPPDHQLAHRYIMAVLAPEHLQGAAATITAIARDLLAKVPPDGRFDAATDYADLLPPLVMAWYLGLPGPLVLEFVRATAEIGRTFDRGCSPRYYARMEALITEQRQPFQHLVEARRRDPGFAAASDGLSRMIALADKLRPMSDQAIADHAMFLIMAGSENTAALIGNAIAAVVEAGPECDLSATDDATGMAAVQETLRFDSPVQQLWRITDRNMELGGARIAAGDRLLLLVGAAHRHPATCPDPDHFDPARFGKGRHGPRGFGLGWGMHYCLGAELGQMEARIALKQIARRKPKPDPDHPFSRRDRQTLRRALHLPVILFPEGDNI